MGISVEVERLMDQRLGQMKVGYFDLRKGLGYVDLKLKGSVESLWVLDLG